jgi:hypothetical protein
MILHSRKSGLQLTTARRIRSSVGVVYGSVKLNTGFCNVRIIINF